METTLMGIIQLDPRDVLEAGVRKELVSQVSVFVLTIVAVVIIVDVCCSTRETYLKQACARSW
jgi:hypothetical protein